MKTFDTLVRQLSEDNYRDRTHEPEFADHTRNPFHEVLTHHGLIHTETSHYKNNGSFHEDKRPDTTAHYYAHPSSPTRWAAAVDLPHQHTEKDYRVPGVYHKDGQGDVAYIRTPAHLDKNIKQKGIWKGR